MINHHHHSSCRPSNTLLGSTPTSAWCLGWSISIQRLCSPTCSRYDTAMSNIIKEVISTFEGALTQETFEQSLMQKGVLQFSQVEERNHLPHSTSYRHALSNICPGPLPKSKGQMFSKLRNCYPGQFQCKLFHTSPSVSINFCKFHGSATQLLLATQEQHKLLRQAQFHLLRELSDSKLCEVSGLRNRQKPAWIPIRYWVLMPIQQAYASQPWRI